ncbi:FLYWCH-type zinc finger-containing protein 1 [Orycteropus afer afer]|uniref:FLYWCH-type zinc finger-containing protein 1 n=1 Tax=Orycteropus afer afer TaxID=1230840 RepID=A0AC54Z9I2_ORYAF|nr:FLYWCH-type zinc finger-containing protein 1 [Orycteropus afer afer]
MPLPEPSEQEAESMRAGQEPTREPGTDLIPAAPRIPKRFPRLVLLAAAGHSRHGLGSRPKGTHCIMSLEMSGPDTLTKALQILPAKERSAVPPSTWPPEVKRLRLDTALKPLEFLKTPFGGRLLVHDSFLYKQEKSVGDKVYWKCREHSERGCRGRAITRGSRVTVMRGHCHPADPEGLEARRQREKLPSPALPEGVGSPGTPTEEPLEGVGPWLCPEEPAPELDRPALEEGEGLQALSQLSLPPKKRPAPEAGETQPLEFLRTCYGGSFLVHDSFLYKREKAVGDKVYWTCREHALHACRSRAITQGARVTIMRAHSHPPDMEGLEARRQQEKAMELLQAQPGGPGGPADKLLRGVDSLLYRRGPGSLTLSRPRPRNRTKPKDQGHRKQPPAPQGPPAEDQNVDTGGPEFLKTPLGGNFLVHNSFLYRREKASGDKVYWTCRDQARMGCRSRAITQGGPEFLKTPLGGNFLVHDSFLYRREKAAGDKVYWTCRDQARLGCRSRAITQGPRVTVMRGHSHPPDLGGLEALRQRERLPGLAQREGLGMLRPLEFLRTSLGGRFLVHESFLYRKEKAAGDKVYWMCRDQARLGCRSRAITQGPQVTVMRGHCHPPDLGGLQALRQREQLPGLAQGEDPEKIQLLPKVQLCFQTCSPESQQVYG